MTRPASRRVVSFARVRAAAFIVLALFLAALSSGAPELIALALGDEHTPCATPCDLSGKDGDCSPVCHSGACARLAPAFVPIIAVVCLGPAVSLLSSGVPASASVSPSSGVVDGVFHPPRV